MRLVLIVAGLVALLLLPVLTFGDAIDQHFSGAEGLARLQAYGDWAWLVGIGLIVADLALPVPATVVISGLGMIYGPWLGGLLGGIGSTLAGLVAYGGCRLLGERFRSFLIGDANLVKLDRFLARYGLWAIALSRWMPLLPEALCCLAGMSRMHTGRFLAALACGSMAMGLAFAFMGVAYADRPIVGLVVSALVPVAVWPVIHLALRDKKKEPEESFVEEPRIARVSCGPE